MGFLRRLFGASREPPAQRQRIDHRAETLPAGCNRLVQGPPVDVHGESHHRAEIEAAVGRRREGHDDIVDAMLVWEPDNQWDPNAIAIHIDGRTCGYMPRPDAKRYRSVMEWARTQSFAPVVRADVTGGWQLADGTWADFGIRLYMASPNKIPGSPGTASSDPVTRASMGRPGHRLHRRQPLRHRRCEARSRAIGGARSRGGDRGSRASYEEGAAPRRLRRRNGVRQPAQGARLRDPCAARSRVLGCARLGGRDTLTCTLGATRCRRYLATVWVLGRPESYNEARDAWSV